MNVYYVLCTLHVLSHLITMTAFEQHLLRRSAALLSQEDLERIWREVVASPNPGFTSGIGL